MPGPLGTVPAEKLSQEAGFDVLGENQHWETRLVVS